VKTVKVKLIGTTPLLQHRMTEEELFGLLGAKSDRKKDKEVLTPRQIATKHVYQQKDGTCYVPAEYVVGAFAHVAGDYKQKNSIRKSIKSIAKGVFRPTTDSITLRDESGKRITDFEIDIRKATNHQKGAVAVCRPRFDKWTLEAEFQVDDSLVSVETCQQILEDAGRRSGIGSFRVSRGGYFGQFRIEEFKEV
jgi:hypothetical protein